MIIIPESGKKMNWNLRGNKKGAPKLKHLFYKNILLRLRQHLFYLIVNIFAVETKFVIQYRVRSRVSK